MFNTINFIVADQSRERFYFYALTHSVKNENASVFRVFYGLAVKQNLKR